MDEPSGFPSFIGLSRALGEGTPLRWDEAAEPPDRFLGRLQRNGTEVHKLTRVLFSDIASHPNALHRSLLRLFRDEQDVRIVTTNYDPHFSAASREVFGEGLRAYTAPALPRGDHFKGIVHLHGSASDNASRIVLTDADFGRAYLTEGWAREFLVALYQSYTVLFVGYSHTDVIVSYLARGTTSSAQRRFALALADGGTDWKHFGITPIAYPSREGDDRHGALREGLEGWATYAATEEMDHERRVRSLVEGDPPEDAQEASYLRQVVRDPHRVRYFTRHARRSSWLWWIEEEGLLDVLFGERLLTPQEIELGDWFVRWFITAHTATSKVVVHRHGVPFNSGTASKVAHRLDLDRRKGEFSKEHFGQWVAFLLNSSLDDYDLRRLLDIAREMGDVETAIVLFDAVTRPRTRLRENYFFGAIGDESEDRRTQFEITTPTDDHMGRGDLRQAWDELLSHVLDDVGWRLISLTASNLARGHDLARIVGATFGDKSDAWGYGVKRIDDDPDDGVSLLVWLGKELVEWQSEQYPEAAANTLSAWRASGYSLLERLSFHLAKGGLVDADQLVREIVEKDLLFSVHLHPEVDEAVLWSYPQLNVDAKTAVLDALAQTVHEGESWEVARAFGILDRLVSESPTCDLAIRRIVELETTRPQRAVGASEEESELLPDVAFLTEHPEADDYLGDVIDQVADVLSPHHDSILSSVRERVRVVPDWGFHIASALHDREDWDTPVWWALLMGWRDASTSDREVWRAALRTLDEFTRIPLPERTAEFVADGLSFDSELPCEHLGLAENLLDRMEDDLVGGSERARKAGNGASRFASAIVEAAVHRRRCAAEWRGLPQAYRVRLIHVLHPKSGGISTLQGIGERFGSLHDLDGDWVRARVLPVLGAKDRRSQAMWQGVFHRVSDSLSAQALGDIVPILVGSLDLFREETDGAADKQTQSSENCTDRLKRLSHEERQVADLLAEAALLRGVDTSAWVGRFVGNSRTEARIRWAQELGAHLNTDHVKAAEAWEAWIEAYWSRRIDGIPAPLDGCEVGAMLRWVLTSPETFARGVDLFCRSPKPTQLDTIALRSLTESSFPEDAPEATARLMDRLAWSPPSVWVFGAQDDVRGVVERLIRVSPHLDVLITSICNGLVRYGVFTTYEIEQMLPQQ